MTKIVSAPSSVTDPSYSPEERLDTIVTMRELVQGFYARCFAANMGSRCHAFLEFAGLMGEFVNLCEDAHAQGIDFTCANVHGGTHLPMAPHRLAYLNEKLECIYGDQIQLATRAAPTKRKGYAAELLPVELCYVCRGPILVTTPTRTVAVQGCTCFGKKGGQ